MKFSAVAKLKPGMRIGQSIIGVAQAEKYTVGYTLTDDDIASLYEGGVPGVYVMEEAPAEILSTELMGNCIAALKKKDLNAIISLAGKIANELKSRPINLNFRSVRSYNEYLLHHSICVAVYAVAVGIRMGMVDAQLQELALAGLLHDIGLIMSDQAVLLKKEKLTAEEYEQIKRHPKEGHDFLLKEARISPAVQEAVLHHHENVNGTGYPERQSEEDIAPYARILHVVDVYDAIMSKRPYKSGMSGAAAINYLIGGKMILFDERIVDKFLEVAIPYPTGSEVRLSNNEVGVVIAQNKDLFRPVLYVEEKRNTIDLAENPSYQDISIQADVVYEGSSKEAGPNDGCVNESNPGIWNRQKKRIMIVDDVYMSIVYTKLALGEEYEVITCQGGSMAVSMAKMEHPDLILMDIDMPDMDGVTAVNEIHKQGLTMPVIFLTGRCDKETVRACGRCGAADYILKPANPVYLRTRVEMALNNIVTNVLL